MVILNSTCRTLISVFILVVFSITNNAYAQNNNVVVIPLGSADQPPLKNVITVAKQNGDFTNPVFAVGSINDASAENPYLVVIAPGVYNIDGNLTFVVPSFVDVVGSGQNSTFIKGTAGSDSSNAPINGAGALVRIRDNSSISNLTIENLGTTLEYGFGLHYNSATATSESAKVSDVTIIVSSNSNSDLLGIRTTNADISVINSKIFVSAGSGGSAKGIETGVVSTPVTVTTNVLNTDIEVVGLANSKAGLSSGNNSNSIVRIQNSTINVPGGFVEFGAGANGNETYISNSFISGSANGGNCSFVFTFTGAAIGSNCI